MNNKKTIILGILVLAVLAGVVWYASQRSSVTEQAASILEEKSIEGESFQLIESEFFLGTPEAPVTIIEYSSHFCGHCANFHLETLPLIMEKYIKTGQAKLIPRRLSPSELGQAVLCAQEQEKFWQVDEYLFKHNQELIEQTQKATSEDDLMIIVADWLKAMAGNLGLNQNAFNQCFDSGRYQERVIVWFEQAQEAEVTGTPIFFINDQMIVGNQSYIVFEEAIEKALTQ